MTLPRLTAAARRAGPALGCRLIVLFGSAAREEQRVAEDVDLAVLGMRPLDPVAVTNRLIRELGAQRVDVADLNRADPLLLSAPASWGSRPHRRGVRHAATLAGALLRRPAIFG